MHAESDIRTSGSQVQPAPRTVSSPHLLDISVNSKPRAGIDALIDCHDNWPCLALRPDIHHALDALQQDLRKQVAPNVYLDVRIWDLCSNFYGSAIAHLSTLISRTIVAAIRPGPKVADMTSYVSTLNDLFRDPNECDRFWSDKPLIFLRARNALDTASYSLLQCVTRLVSDLALLRQFYGLRFNALHEATLAGDLHPDGAVIRLRFADGTLYYKPRPAAIDVQFGELCRWLGHGIDRPSPIIPKTMDRQAYSWQLGVPWAPVDPFSSEASLAYHSQVGILAAAAYITSVIDLHHENAVFTTGSCLAVVDAECVGRGSSDEWILSSGLFPSSGNIDLSLMGAIGRRRPAKTAWSVDFQHPGRPRFRRRALAITASQHLPSIRSSVSELWEDADDMFSALRDSLRFVGAEGPRLLEQRREPFEGFRGLVVRKLSRSTNAYGHILWLLGDLRAAASSDVAESICEQYLSPKDSISSTAAEMAMLLDGVVPRFFERLIAEPVANSLVGEKILRLDEASIDGLCAAARDSFQPLVGIR